MIKRAYQTLQSKSPLLVLLLGGVLSIIFHSQIVAAAHNNLGSLRLNRAMLAPALSSEDRLPPARRAGQAFQSALAWDADYARPYYNLGTLYDFYGDQALAGESWSQAAALAPGDESAQFAHGMALADQGREEEAIEAWRAAEAAVYFVRRGLNRRYDGDRQGAVEAYQRALAIDPNLWEGYYHLARAMNALGRRDDALLALESAAEMVPASSAQHHLLWGEVHVAREEWTAALAALGRAASLEPWNPVPYYRMGSILRRRLGDRAAAVANFQEALRRDPDYSPARFALARMYAEPRSEEGEASAVDCDQAARWLSPLLWPSDRPIPSLYDSDGDDDQTDDQNDERGDARTMLDARLAARAHTLLARCLQEEGAEREAVLHWERAAVLRSDSVEAYLSLAQAYVQAQAYPQAIEAYGHVLELAPDHTQARQALEALGGSD
jgi:tetratricopeptide (TPR) repeat protein